MHIHTLQGGDKYKGKSVYVAGDNIPVADIMAEISKATGKPFKYVPVSREAYAGFGFPGADDLAAMFDYYKREPEFCKHRDVDGPMGSKALFPGVQSVAVWAEANKEALSKLA